MLSVCMLLSESKNKKKKKTLIVTETFDIEWIVLICFVVELDVFPVLRSLTVRLDYNVFFDASLI